MDVRPATGQLWVLTDADRLYTVNTGTGAATAVGDASAVDLAGETGFGFDFDPMADQVRVTNTSGQNLRFDPNTGSALDLNADTALAFAPADPNFGATPRVVGIARSNNVAAMPSTTFYAIDSALDALATLGGATSDPETGQLFTLGPTDVD